MLSDEQLAAVAYEVERDTRASILGHFPQEFQGWADLSPLDRTIRLEFAKTVREMLMDDPDMPLKRG